MPRQSSAAQSLASYGASFGRLQPPSDMGGLERELFLTLVASLDPQHFESSDLPMVAAYVRACCMERRAAETLMANPRDADALAAFGVATRAMAALSLRLRLSPQSRKPNHRARVSRSAPSAYEVMAR